MSETQRPAAKTASGHGPIGHRTGLCAVLLHPAAHTRSPAMHNAAFRALGLDARFLAFDVAPERLAEALSGARALGFRQLAISIPHKEAVMQHLDDIDQTARAIGAVNTVTREGERLVGANTDWLGLVRALERHGELAGRRAVVLGAGGAARAAVFGLQQRGARVHVLNRSAEKARRLARELGADGAGALGDLADIEYDLLINATRVGLSDDTQSPVANTALRAGGIVFDTIYEPAETKLLRDARAAGAEAVGGKWMLVYQAAEQIRLWSGREVDPEILATAFDAAGSAGAVRAGASS